MTAGFGTSNICWVPEGQHFRLVDLLNWVEWRIDTDALRVALAPEGCAAIAERAREGFDLCRTRYSREGPERLEVVDRAEQFIADLGDLVPPAPDAVADLSLPQGPLSSLWVRVSDAPLESFFDDDYRSAPRDRHGAVSVPTLGSVNLPTCDDLDIPLEASDGTGFTVLTPTADAVGEYPLPPGEMLPILDEFCGFHGNSNQGKMVNLTLEGRIARENPVCVPLHRLSKRSGFLTAYFHFTTPGDSAVSVPVRPRHVHRVEASLRDQGFDQVDAVGRNQIWRRSEDWVHCLWNTPGLESHDVSVLPPFLVVAQAEGSRSPALREALLAAILQTALGNIPQRGDKR